MSQWLSLNNLELWRLVFDVCLFCIMLLNTFSRIGDCYPYFVKLALLSIGGVCTNNCLMVGGILCGMYIWEPLKCGSRPLNGSSKKKIILLRSFFFPYFVLLVDDHLFFFVMICIGLCLPSAMFPLKSK